MRWSKTQVCARCIDDPDLRRRIQQSDGERGCDFCNRRDSATIDIADLAEFMRERLLKFYGRADEQVPYDPEDDAYIGKSWSTYDLLFDELQLDFPRQVDDELRVTLADLIGDEFTWSEFDWAAGDFDDILIADWQNFCNVVRYRRRFFFHEVDVDDLDAGHMAPLEMLAAIRRIVNQLDLVRIITSGYKLYRARKRSLKKPLRTAEQLGPPPPSKALVSNRMNPPGIPMFYGADRRRLSIAETRSASVTVGTFITTRDARILDLAKLPSVPGIFSDASRDVILGLRFLHHFAGLIVEPSAGDDRTHIDYIPTQVFTEFLRDSKFAGAPIDGLRYKSATGIAGTNVVLFATQANLVGGARTEEEPSDDQWLLLKRHSPRLRP